MQKRHRLVPLFLLPSRGRKRKSWMVFLYKFPQPVLSITPSFPNSLSKALTKSREDTILVRM